MDSTDPPPQKRKRFDWTTKTDPDTGAVTRFCSRCQDFLPLDRFYACHVKNGDLICKTHSSERSNPAKIVWNRQKRGKLGSVSRVRSNLNAWIVSQKRGWKKWTEEEVKRALIKHSVDLASESRIVRLRPSDHSKTFDVDNSVVKFQNGTSRKPSSKLKS